MKKPFEKSEVQQITVPQNIQKEVNQILKELGDRGLEKFLIQKDILKTTTTKSHTWISGVKSDMYALYMEAKRNFYK